MALRGEGSRRRVKQSQAWERIREAILAGYFRMGERLSEEDLAFRLGMSRTPVREALHRLSQEGLVHNAPETGWAVVDLALDDVTHLYQVRANLEGMAARLAAERQVARDVRELGSLVDAAEDAAAHGDLGGLQRIQQRFHLVLAAASGNGVLIELLTNLSVRAGLTMSIALGRHARRVESAAEHRRIVDAIAAARPAAAERAARAHMSRSLQKVAEGLAGRLDPFRAP